MSDSLWAHGLQHTRLPCPSLSPGVCSNSCSLTQWCHTAISSSAAPFPFAFSLPGHQGSSTKLILQIRWPKYWASASVLPMNIKHRFPVGLTCLISLWSKEFSRVSSSTTVQKHQFFSTQPSLWSNSYIHTWLLEKPYFWLYKPLLAKWCLCFLIHCLGLS